MARFDHCVGGRPGVDLSNSAIIKGQSTQVDGATSAQALGAGGAGIDRAAGGRAAAVPVGGGGIRQPVLRRGGQEHADLVAQFLLRLIRAGRLGVGGQAAAGAVDRVIIGLWCWGSTALRWRCPMPWRGCFRSRCCTAWCGARLARPAGLAAALVLAVMPVTIATERNNTMDGLMTFAVMLAAWGFASAAGSGRLRPLLLGAVALGLAFNIKELEAFMPLPAFYGVLPAGRAGPLAGTPGAPGAGQPGAAGDFLRLAAGGGPDPAGAAPVRRQQHG